MAFAGTSGSEVLAAGGQNNILMLNVDRGSVVKQVRQVPEFREGNDGRSLLRNGIPSYDGVGSLWELRCKGISMSLIRE